MALIYNGTTLSSSATIKYNGTSLTKIIYGTTTVWQKAVTKSVTSSLLKTTTWYWQDVDNKEYSQNVSYGITYDSTPTVSFKKIGRTGINEDGTGGLGYYVGEYGYLTSWSVTPYKTYATCKAKGGSGAYNANAQIIFKVTGNVTTNA